MKSKPILIVAGEPKSIFFEIFFKSYKLNRFKSPIILISSFKLIKSYLSKKKINLKINVLDEKKINSYNLNNQNINLINVNCLKTDKYIEECFNIAVKILKTGFSNKFINGPINKSKFLNKKFLGITEYISQKFNVKKKAMLIYNEDLSVCPVTTHLPISLISKKISKELIKEKAILINNFFIKHIGYKPKIAVTGLNPHCESILKNNEDIKIVRPAVNALKEKGLKIYGPYPADTIFLKQNRKKYNVILGMYHDQVLSPIKSLKEYDAINITLGLPFFRVSPDHGPNEKMINKDLSNPLSLTKAIKFLDRK